MPGRIVLFGATGYTGRLTAEAMVARGDRPVLAGRNAERLAALAEELGGLETAIADVAEPASVRALVEPGDALVATVGPFARWGDPRSRRRSMPAPATSTRPESRRSSAGCSSGSGRPPSKPGPGW